MPEIRKYTQGQIDEALAWFQENEPELITSNSLLEDLTDSGIDGFLVDTYFLLKETPIQAKPTEFLVGIEYKDAEAVQTGKEPVNIAVHNPHKKGEYDDFAFAVLVNILQNMKS